MTDKKAMAFKLNEPKLTPDNSFAVPNDLIDHYMKLFNLKELGIIMGLCKQSYEAGLQIGRSEKKKGGAKS